MLIAKMSATSGYIANGAGSGYMPNTPINTYGGNAGESKRKRRADGGPPDISRAPDAQVSEVKVNVFSRLVEAIFTTSIIFSTALMPFVLVLMIGPMFAPGLVVTFITPPLVYLAIPYILVMVIVGAKISSLFGCSLWSRLISDPESGRHKHR